MKYFLTLFILLILILSCTIKQKENQIDADLLVVDLDNMPLKNDVVASAFFKNQKSIILETTDKSLIGNIFQLYIDDNYIVVLDDSENMSVLVFNIDGSFSHKIGGLGQGPQEYTNIADFMVDRIIQEIYLLDASESRIKKYNLRNGKFIHSFSIKPERYSNHIQYCNNRLYVDANLKTDEKSLLYQINKETGEEIKSWLNADKYNQGWMASFFLGNSFFQSRNANEVKYSQIYMDTVVSIHQNTVSPFMVVKSKSWVTCDELSKAYETYGVSTFNEMMDLNKKFGITNLIETNEGLFFQYLDGRNQLNIYYSKEDAYSFMAMFDDFLFKKEKAFPLNLIWADSKGVYTYHNLVRNTSFAGASLKEIINPNVDKYNEIITLTEDANPVISYYEFKD